MTLRANVAEALSVLLEHRLRSALTILGLVIGVAAVIAILTLGTGTAGAVAGLLGGLSDRAFTVFPNAYQAEGSRAALHAADIEKIKRIVPNLVAAVPAGGVARVVRNGHAHARLQLSGETAVRFTSTPLAYGRAISQSDIDGTARVCVLSDRAYKRLFPEGGNPVGESLRVGDERFVIAGVYAAPSSGIIPVQLVADVSLPYTTYVREYVRNSPVFGGRFLVGDPARITETEAATVRALVALKKGNVVYQTFDRRTFTASIDAIFDAMTFVVGAIGAVALVVAGIGILNIMLVSVAERTHEIGIRKALGATRAQILAQFFIEALVLAAAGCTIGLVIGIGIGLAVNGFFLVRLSGIVAPIPWLQSAAVAVAFAALVALVFGTYPAYRAARLDPIEALRYE
ncbi:MAG: ABC transporter permease [Vulcanimicrobiaceae bacterium]